MRDNIKVLDRYNPQRIPITPLGVHSLKAADVFSRDCYFVALCRAFNIPARIEEISGKVQYYDSGYWIDAATELSSESADASVSKMPSGFLMLTDSNLDNIDPKFESHLL